MQRRLLYILILCLFLTSCVKHSHDVENHHRADSLYTELSAMRYSDIAAFDSLAKDLFSMAADDNELQMVANNAMAYSAMMQMDYNRSVELYRTVRDKSLCEIERLVADVGLMTICYRVSANRLFFDYRSSALSRIKRINEEYDYLSLDDRERFNRAKVEFAIVSVCYFSNLAMQNECGKVLEKLESNIENVEDVALRLYARMMLSKNFTDRQKYLSSLLTGLAIAERNNIVWLEANYRLLLAISLRDSNMLQIFAKEFPDKVTLLLPRDTGIEELPSLIASDATEAFARYGDEYMMIEALAVQASCHTRLEKYEESLSLLSEAYDKISVYYKERESYIPSNDLDSLLYGMNEAESLVTDMNAGIYHIPECLLSVCREASCAYAGMGDKEASYINRDLYLNILRTTRLNKHLESRISILENNIADLRITALISLSLLILLSSLLFLVHRRRHKREKTLSAQRKKMLKVCRLLFSSLPNNIENKQQLVDAISKLLNETLGDFSGKTQFLISEESCYSELPNQYCFDICYVNSTKCDKLIIASELPLDTDKKSLVVMLMPYIAVAIEEGIRLSKISDEREKVEEMKRASEIYLAEHKRENILKRVSVSILSSMRTFMDRISNELKNLTEDIPNEDTERKLHYISELTDKLDDLNLILERWIKTRRGEVNLRIENFAIADIFAIMEKNRRLFDTRGISLILKPSDCVAKADKALTLFMINTLVDNAAKFTIPGGSVVLESVERDGYVEISVTDTGVGLSQTDIERILGSKVYDASLIGKDNELLKPKSKGGGFGLMNCKGIIEKYRKSGSIFSVCSFDISSTKGVGSRFSFRLPKGVLRILLLLVSLLPVQMSANEYIFEQINEYADSVFMCNVNGNHNDAFVVAQEALDLLNSYYTTTIGGDDTLSLSSGVAAELLWWRNSLFLDSLKEDVYYNILDIRNEISVASLALNNWNAYNYNNHIYTTLYRLVHEDNGITDYYSSIQQIENNYEAVIAFSCFLILLLLVYCTITFIRYNVIEKTNERLVLEMNSRLLNVTTKEGKRSINGLIQDFVNEIYSCLSETMCIKEVAMLLNTVDGSEKVIAFTPAMAVHDKSDIYMQSILESGESAVLSSGMIRIIPLHTMHNGERIAVGILRIITERPLSENEIVSIELISNYLASVAYHSAVRVVSGYMAIEELEEEAERMRYEENRLHVQNMVMDNCLSVIKHETLYYPCRIKELAEKVLVSIEDKKSSIADMRELMEYYNSVFGILCNCAVRELDGTSFKFKKVELHDLFNNAKRNAERMIRKAGIDIKVVCEDCKSIVMVDADLVDYLFEQLFTVALKIKKQGTLLLRAEESAESVMVEFVDNRYNITNDEVAEMFTPTKRNIDNAGGVNAMEYLVAKEIVRLHEDYTGKHGGRMEARSDVSGTVILFTLPK